MNEKDLFDILFHPWTMMWLGQLLHLLQTLRGFEAAGSDSSLIRYVRAHPWAILFSMVAGVICYGLALGMNQLNALSGFGIGFAADSVINSFVQRASDRLSHDDPPPKGAPL